MNNKIIEHYKTGFSSSPIEVEPKEIQFIIKHECECSRCGKSIFEMDDFPELLTDDDEIMCEECYDEHYREYCPICENSYDTKDYEAYHFVITEEVGAEIGKTPGIYKALTKPFFYGNIVTGFDAFFDHAIELVAPIRMNLFKKIDCGDSCCEVSNDMICPECVEKYVRKANYLKSDRIPCILLKRYENDSLFADYTKEELQRLRQHIIHKRITCRGMIERANHIADYGKSGRAKLLKRSSSQNVESKNECSTCS